MTELLADAARLWASEFHQRVPGLPEEFLVNLDAPVRTNLSHSQIQAVIYASQVLAPGLARDAFTERTNGHDLLAWLGEPKAAEASSSKRSAHPRGSYRTDSVRLRPMAEDDVSALYFASLEPQNAHRWRFRGATPPPEAFRRALFGDTVLAQFMVVSAEDGSSVGLVTAYSADLAGGTCYIAVQRVQAPGSDVIRNHAGMMVEGFLVFVQYVFDHFGLHKLYLELPEYNTSLISGGAESILVKEGHLVGHYLYGGRRWDQHIYALYRTRFDEVASLFRRDWDDGRATG